MAETIPDTKAELAAELARSRASLTRGLDAVRQDLDVGRHLKHSFHEHKAAYIGGATVFGLLLSKLPLRRRKAKAEPGARETIRGAEKAGLWLVILQFLFKTFRPAITSFVTKQVTNYVRSRGQDRS